jgi:predicted transcriptional regulator
MHETVKRPLWENGPMSKRKYWWLVPALAERGHTQRDVANAWKVDDATVSRFISTGKPKATLERFRILAQMLGMSNDELMARLVEDVPPRHVASRSAAGARAEKSKPPPNSVEAALDDAKKAVQRLRELMPDARIHFSIDYSDSGQ